MGALLALAAILGLFAFGGKRTTTDAPQPTDELGTRVAKFSVTDTAISPTATFEVYITTISSDQFGWYAYKGGARIGSGSGADDDVTVASAWEFLVSQISSGASVTFEIFGPNGTASGKVDPQGGATIEDWRWDAASGNKSKSAVENTRGAAILAMLDWIETNLSNGKQGTGQPGAGKHVGNGISFSDDGKSISVYDFASFLSYAKPRIEAAFAGNKPPSAQTLATKTIGPAAGTGGTPRPQTMINGKPWSQIEPVVKDTIAKVASPTWLSVAEPTAVLAHMLVNTVPNEKGIVQDYRGHAIVVRARPVGGVNEALVFPGPARTLDADAEVLAIPGFTLAQMLTRAQQRVNAIEGGVIGPNDLGGNPKEPPLPAPPKPHAPPLPAPPKPGKPPGWKDWTCASQGYNPAAKTHQIPLVSWTSRKTVEIELFHINGKWANCTRYDVRVGMCLRWNGFGVPPYGPLSPGLMFPSVDIMAKVPAVEIDGSHPVNPASWTSPPAWKSGLRVKVKLQGSKWILDGAAESISATEASINACPGVTAHWPEPAGAHFNMRAESGAWAAWDPKVTAEVFLSGNKVMLRLSYAGLPQFKKHGSSYRAQPWGVPLALATRVDARGEP